MQLFIESEVAMERLGNMIAGCLKGGEIVYLKGELGAGKTTLTRGLLRGLGYSSTVKSPTYTLVENYELSTLTVYHFDLYRLNDPEELEDMGIRDYCHGQAVCLFEWPERGTGVLPDADLMVVISHASSARDVTVSAGSATGNVMLDTLAEATNFNPP